MASTAVRMGNTKGITPQTVMRWSTAPCAARSSSVAPAYRAHLKMVALLASKARASFHKHGSQDCTSKDLMMKTSTRLPKSAAGVSTA